jgi:hypothetical protein
MTRTELPITEVILQPDNAIIRRGGKISLSAGLNAIEIEALDPNLYSESLQVIISGEEIVIHKVKFSIVTIEKTAEKSELQNQIKAHEIKIRELEIKRADLEFWLNQFDRIQGLLAESFPHGYAEAKVRLLAYTEFDDHLETKVVKNTQEKEQIEKTLQGIQEEIAEIRKQIEEISQTVKKERKGHINLNVESVISQQVDIQLEYLLPAGKWNMFYELQLKDESYTLTKWVEITNTSAEAWNDVELTLTDKIRSDISINPPQLAFLEPEKGIESEFLIPVQSILLPTSVSIQNDSQPYKFEIGREEISSTRYIYYWNAANFADVVEILIIALKNYLYPAPINVFLEGIFLDSINHMDFIPPGDEIGIPLRAIKTIQTSKRGVDKEIKQTGMIKKQTEVEYNYILGISNPFEHEINMVVYERIPEPVDLKQKADVDLYIDYKTISKLPYKVFENGLVRWDLLIPPRGQKELYFQIKLVRVA